MLMSFRSVMFSPGRGRCCCGCGRGDACGACPAGAEACEAGEGACEGGADGPATDDGAADSGVGASAWVCSGLATSVGALASGAVDPFPVRAGPWRLGWLGIENSEVTTHRDSDRWRRCCKR